MPVGLSSFYSELMKGFGAGARLWELLDRKPEFSQNGKHTLRQKPHNANTPCVVYFTLIGFYLFGNLNFVRVLLTSESFDF